MFDHGVLCLHTLDSAPVRVRFLLVFGLFCDALSFLSDGGREPALTAANRVLGPRLVISQL